MTERFFLDGEIEWPVGGLPEQDPFSDRWEEQLEAWWNAENSSWVPGGAFPGGLLLERTKRLRPA